MEDNNIQNVSPQQQEESPISEAQALKETLPPVSNASMYMMRLGKIFSRFAFACTILLVLASLSIILLPLAQVFLIVVILIALFLMIIFTFGLVFALPSKPIDKVWDFFLKAVEFKFSTEIASFCFSLLPYLSYIGIGCSILSILTLAFAKNGRRVGRIIAVCIVMLLMIIPLVVYNSMGGVLWQN